MSSDFRNSIRGIAIEYRLEVEQRSSQLGVDVIVAIVFEIFFFLVSDRLAPMIRICIKRICAAATVRGRAHHGEVN